MNTDSLLLCHLARRRHHQLGRVPALEVRVHEHRLHVDLGHVLGRGPLHPPPVRREVGHDLLQHRVAQIKKVIVLMAYFVFSDH